MPSTPSHNTVSLRGFHFEDSHLGFKLTAGIDADDIGKAVAINTAAANTVKLAGDGDYIVGRLETVEDRTVEGLLVGTVALRFSNLLPIKTGETVAVGDTVVGAGAGEVKALADSTAAGGKVYIPFEIEATELAAGTPTELVSPVAGRIARVRLTTQTAIVTGGAVTVEVNTVAVDGLSIAVADGAAAGTRYADVPTAAHASAVVAAGDRIEIIPASEFNGGGALRGVLEIDLAATPNHFRNFVAEVIGTNAVVVKI